MTSPLLELKNKSSIVFDMDGTLIDSEPFHYDAINSIFKISQRGSIDWNTYISEFFGLSDPDIYIKVKELIPELRLSQDEFIVQKNKLILDTIKNLPLEKFKSYLIGGVENFLKNLSQLKIPLGLVTNSERVLVEATLEKLNFLDFFSFIVTRTDVNEGKPNPEPYLKMFELLEVSPNDSLIFEDSPSGIRAAMETGATVIKIGKEKFDSGLRYNQEIGSFLEIKIP